MQQLQHNYTTPEQSYRLLELGIPADSADLQIPYIEYYDLSPSDNEKIVQCYEYLAPIFWDETERGLLPKDKVVWEREFAGEKYDSHTTEYIPCWSVGRLIEIYEICSGEKFERELGGSSIMQDAYDTIIYLWEDLNVSKLEDLI